MNPEILKALENFHKALWEEMRAPCGHHQKQAEIKRIEAERNFKRKLATVNPRDVLIYKVGE